jgi:hypothetical protein
MTSGNYGGPDPSDADPLGPLGPLTPSQPLGEVGGDFRAIGFFTADHAVVESGKVYASGAYWQTLAFPQFPAALPAAAIVAIISIPWHANNSDHQLSIDLVDSDGHRKPEFEISGQFRGAAGPQMKYGEPGLLPVAIPVFGLEFGQPGDYSFVLRVDGQELARYAVSVRQAAFPGAPGGGGPAGPGGPGGPPPPPRPPSPTTW